MGKNKIDRKLIIGLALVSLWFLGELNAGIAPVPKMDIEKAFEGNWYENGATYTGATGTYSAKNRPNAVYVASQSKTFFVYGGKYFTPMISYYDHSTGLIAESVLVGPQTIMSGFRKEDAHTNPSMMIDDDGYIFVFYGDHDWWIGTSVAKSVSAYDISEWTDCAVLGANTAYPQAWEILVEDAYGGTVAPGRGNLTGMWMMNESAWNGTADEARDSSGNNLHGVAVNNADTTASGKIGRAGQFSRQNSRYVNLGDVLDFGTGDFSISLWVRYEESPSNHYMVGKYQNSANKFYLRGYITTKVAHCYVRIADAIVCHFWGGTEIPLNTWTHLVFVADRDTGGIVYFNGSEDSTTSNTMTATDIQITGDLHLGGYDTYELGGRLDAVMFFDKALTANEVSFLYNNGAGRETCVEKKTFVSYRTKESSNTRQSCDTSSDDCATWDGEVDLVDYTGGDSYRPYAVTIKGSQTPIARIHLAWTVHDVAAGDRYSIYYMYSDDGGLNWRRIDGDIITLPVSDLAAGCRVIDTSTSDDYLHWSDMQLDSNGNPLFLFTVGSGTSFNFKFIYWTGSAWDTNTIVATDHAYDTGALVIIASNDYRAFMPCIAAQANRQGGDIDEYKSTDGGDTWAKQQSLTTSSTYSHGYIKSVLNSHADFRILWSYGDSSYQGASVDYTKESRIYIYGENQSVTARQMTYRQEAYYGDLSDDLLAWWKMNDNAANATVADSSGNNEDGTLTGTSPTTAAHHIDSGNPPYLAGALDLNGTDNQIDTTLLSNELNLSRTFAGWFRMDATPTDNSIDYRMITSSNGTSSRFVIGPEYETNRALFTAGIRDTAFRELPAPETSLSNSTWYFGAATYDGTNLKVYLDGKIQGRGDYVFDDDEDTHDVELAAFNSVREFDGGLDNLMVFDRALTEQEIRFLYNIIEGTGHGTEKLSRTATVPVVNNRVGPHKITPLM